MQRWRRRRDDDRRQTLQQQTLFSHKANPMYDTTQTLTTTSSSARGDDFEVIRVPPGQPPVQDLSSRETMYPDPMTYVPPLFTVRLDIEQDVRVELHMLSMIAKHDECLPSHGTADVSRLTNHVELLHGCIGAVVCLHYETMSCLLTEEGDLQRHVVLPAGNEQNIMLD